MSQSSLSSKIHKKKSSTSLPETKKIQRRKKQQEEVEDSSSRDPFKDLSNGGISSISINSRSNDTCSNASSISSIEAPKGCLRFFRSHSPSFKTPFSNNRDINRRPLKVQPICSKTPKSAPYVRPIKDNSTKGGVFRKTISQKVEKVKSNPPCLYQWKSGRKTSSRDIPSTIIYSGLESRCNVLKSGCGELKQVDVDGVRDCNAANLTPLSKVANRSGLDFAVNGTVVVDDDEKSNSNAKADSKSSNTKTPPVQASVSPEIRYGSSMKSITTTTTTPICYGAGHVVSGITDKRKCRPRGILTVGEAKALGSFDSDDDAEQNKALEPVNDSRVPALPLPAEASMHWLLSPCNEEDEDQKEKCEIKPCHLQRVEDCMLNNSPASSLLGNDGFSSDLCNNSAERSISSASTRKRKGISLLSSNEFPEFQGFLGHPFCNNLAVSSLEEEQKCNLDEGNSPLYSMGSGNIIQTPKSGSTSDRQVRIPWLSADSSTKKQDFESELNLVADHLQMASLSSKSHVSIWDPASSSLQFDCLTTPSNSVNLSQFQKILDGGSSWFSSSSLENVSQSQMRISWREGLISRIFEMDEFDCCRCLSDEEKDIKGCNIDYLKSPQNPELNVGFMNDHVSPNGFGSTEFVDGKYAFNGKAKQVSPRVNSSCAESISTDGGGLLSSEDADWTLCYKNQLFKCN